MSGLNLKTVGSSPNLGFGGVQVVSTVSFNLITAKSYFLPPYTKYTRKHYCQLLSSSSFFFFFFLVFFLGPHPRPIGFPRLGGKSGAVAEGLHHSHRNARSEHIASAVYTTAHHNLRSFNPLSEARDQTCILIDTSQIH